VCLEYALKRQSSIPRISLTRQTLRVGGRKGSRKTNSFGEESSWTATEGGMHLAILSGDSGARTRGDQEPGLMAGARVGAVVTAQDNSS